VNARKNVPSVDGAATSCPSSASVRPARSTSQSSMQSAPNAIAETSVITLRPGFAAPPRSPRSTRQRFKVQPLRQQRRQHDPGVRDRPLIIKTHLQTIASDRLGILHHVDDLLAQAVVALINR